MPIVDPERFNSATLDYLVVGGGTAGLALAARLSENPNVRVGVIEAGTHDVAKPEITLPGKSIASTPRRTQRSPQCPPSIGRQRHQTPRL
jgi:choline dehydrogenase-like flavoprotein